MTSGQWTPSWNQNIESSYSRRSVENGSEQGYSSCHPSAPAGVSMSKGLGNRSAMALSFPSRPGSRPGRVRAFTCVQRGQQGGGDAGHRIGGGGRGRWGGGDAGKRRGGGG